jgi:hypothetical protein
MKMIVCNIAKSRLETIVDIDITSLDRQKMTSNYYI